MNLATRLVAVICSSLLLVVPTFAKDEACSKLKKFEQMTLSRNEAGRPKREWVEVRYKGAWLDFERGFGWYCKTSESKQAEELCNYLASTSSREFLEILPQRILDCHGASIGDAQSEYPWIHKLKLFSDEHRDVYVEIALGNPTGEDAVRISIFGDLEDEESQPLPPLIKAKDFSFGN